MRLFWLIRLLLLAALILSAIALVPRRLGESNVFHRETPVIAAIRTIHTAETEYYSQYGHYAVTLRELAPLLDDTLASRARTGYRFTLAEKHGGYIRIGSSGSFPYRQPYILFRRDHGSPRAAGP